jgi:PIN like domain
MKKVFASYYRPTEKEFSVLWEKCLFVLDANVLLNLYRYTSSTNQELINILTQISTRLWMPYQAALEYQERRLEVIAEQVEAYDSIQKLVDGSQNDLESKLKSYTRHPFVNIDGLISELNGVFAKFKIDVGKHKQKHPDLLNTDHLRETVTKLLDGKVGQSYPVERLEEIKKTAKIRYENEMPPGFKDTKKGEPRQYNDLVIWFQVIDKAKEVKKPIIFITDDRKEDWWLKFKGKTIGPRPELIAEMTSEADVSFYMYQPDQFMKYARKHLKRQVKEDAIKEVQDVRRRSQTILGQMYDSYQRTQEVLRQLQAQNAAAHATTPPGLLTAALQQSELAQQALTSPAMLAALRQSELTQQALASPAMLAALRQSEFTQQALTSSAMLAAFRQMALQSTGSPIPDADVLKTSGTTAESEKEPKSESEEEDTG